MERYLKSGHHYSDEKFARVYQNLILPDQSPYEVSRRIILGQAGDQKNSRYA